MFSKVQRLPLAAGVFAWALCLAPTGARAQVLAAPSLHWVRGPGADVCIGPRALAKRVEQELRRNAFVAPSEAAFAIEGEARSEGQGHVATLVVRDRDGVMLGRRVVQIEGPCDALDEAVVLILAITLRGAPGGIPLPDGTLEQLESQSGDEPSELDVATLPGSGVPQPKAPPEKAQTAGPSTGSAAPVDAPDPLPEDTADLRLSITAGGFVQSGVQPGAALGPMVGLRLETAELGTWEVRAHLGTRRVDQRVLDPSADGPQGTAESLGLRWSTALIACPLALRPNWATLSLCVSAAVGQVGLDGTRDFAAFNSDRSRDRLWAALGIGGGMRRTIAGPLSVFLDAEVDIRVRPVEYTFLGADGRPYPLFATDPVGITVAAGLALALF